MSEMIPATYFVALGDDRYEPTAHATGAWREDELHLGPVAGLVVHHMERWREAHADPAHMFSRFSIEVQGQIARDVIELSTEVIRPGRTIELIETTAVIGGRVTLRARAWLLQTSDTVEIAGHHFDPMPEPESLSRRSSLLDWPGGLVASIDGVSSDDNVPGRGQTWVTSPYDLVDGEHSMPLAEYAKLLDTSNGVAVRESPNEWMFPNVELSLHFFREPRGRWVGFDTRVAFGAEGIGLTSSVMHDLDGPVGTINQSLTLRRLEG